VAPTVVAEDDPYQSLAPVLRARVAQVTEPPPALADPEDPADPVALDPIRATPLVAQPLSDPVAEPVPALPAVPVDSYGIPIARPVLVENEDEDIPAQRVRLGTPRAIEFID